MKTDKCQIKKEQQTHVASSYGERREFIASLSALSSTHAIVETKVMSNNRITMSLEGIGDWIYYANTGTCFKACNCDLGDKIHHQLTDESVHHTYRGSMKIYFDVA